MTLGHTKSSGTSLEGCDYCCVSYWLKDDYTPPLNTGRALAIILYAMKIGI